MPNGGGGGESFIDQPYPGTPATETVFEASSSNYYIGTSPILIKITGCGGGGSSYGTGGAGGYMEAYFSDAFTLGTGYINVTIGDAGVFGANGGTGGGICSVEFISAASTMSSGGGGGAGGQNATAGTSGEINFSDPATVGGTGDESAAGNGGDSRTAAYAQYRVEKSSTSRSPGWDGTFGDGGIIGGDGNKGRVLIYTF